MKITPELAAFLDYCYEWYGQGGVYDHGASHIQIAKCVMAHLDNPDREAEFHGDSLDREQVREWLSSIYGLEEVGNQREGVAA
jgi:hypothetical protein